MKNVMLDSCFVLLGTHQQPQILVLTFALVCSFPPTNSAINHHNFRPFDDLEALSLRL
jgi:hypothetical protein